MKFGKEMKAEACEVLSSTYATLAGKVGRDKEEAYDEYMSRCLDRDNEVVCEQVLREAFKRITKDSSLSWVREYEIEKAKREKAEESYRKLKETMEESNLGEKKVGGFILNSALL